MQWRNILRHYACAIFSPILYLLKYTSAVINLRHPTPAHPTWLWLLLGLAAALRLVGLNNSSPPGLAHDEVAHWLINNDILAGNHAIYFTDAYGHEAGYHYLQALFQALLGDHALALRLPSAFLGLLVVAVSYQLVRLLFGRAYALPATAVHALLFMPIFYSRLGLRAIALPLLGGLAAYLWWRWWLQRDAPPLSWPIIAAGICGGLASHTYMASRALPIFFALFIAYLALTDWPTVRRRLAGLGAFTAVYLLISLPLILFLWQTPTAEFRLTEIDAPLRALQAGDVRPVLHNAWLILLGFGAQGDPLWRQNVAGLPLFDPLLGTAFYVGLGVLVWHWRNPRHVFVLLWIACATIPSLLSVDAPSNIRMIGFLPLLAVPPLLVVIPMRSQLSTLFPQLSTDLGIKWWINGLTLLILVFHSGRTIHHLYDTWPNEPDEVRFVWQAAFTEMAQAIQAHPTWGATAVAGWSPESMDDPTLRLLLWPTTPPVRHFGQVGEVQTVIIPHRPAGQGAAVIRPHILPLNPLLAARLAQWAGPEQPAAEISVSLIPPDTPAPPPAIPHPALFGGELALLGYDVFTTAETLELITQWQVIAPPTAERRLFLHQVAPNGETIHQHDGLAAPTPFWQTGDIIWQYHILPASAAPFELRLGVYDPTPPWPRLPTAEGGDFVTLNIDRDGR